MSRRTQTKQKSKVFGFRNQIYQVSISSKVNASISKTWIYGDRPPCLYTTPHIRCNLTSSPQVLVRVQSTRKTWIVLHTTLIGKQSSKGTNNYSEQASTILQQTKAGWGSVACTHKCTCACTHTYTGINACTFTQTNSYSHICIYIYINIYL